MDMGNSKKSHNNRRNNRRSGVDGHLDLTEGRKPKEGVSLKDISIHKCICNLTKTLP